MRVSQIITLALRTLIRNPLRSFFMMLGVAIGIASLTAMASIGEATQQETIRQFKRMVGTYDLVSIVPGAASTRGMPSLTTVEPS
ncbi:MAG: ABC transporter permease, partial [Gammaproteobacteria bacterium]|nr:ABC transporter permease [Gammaproteobacteria bacterium]